MENNNSSNTGNWLDLINGLFNPYQWAKEIAESENKSVGRVLWEAYRDFSEDWAFEGNLNLHSGSAGART